MVKSPNSSVSVCLVLLSCLLLLISGKGRIESFACPATVAGCPETTNDGWPQNATVYYSIDSSVNLPGEQAQIQSAIDSWNAANAGNNSAVAFVPADGSHSASLTFRNGTISQGTAAVTIIVHDGQTGAATNAYTTFDPAASFANGNAYYDENQPGYTSIFLKVALHEIGHTMGLCDEDFPAPQSSCGGQQPQISVMNSACGTNDYNPYQNQPDIMPTYVTTCDNQSVSSQSRYPSQTGGGGSGGGCESIDADGDGWNSCVDCNDNHYDPSNNCDPGDPGGGCYPDPCGCGYYHGYVYYYNDYDECWEKHEVEQYVCDGQVMWETDTNEGCYYE